jgi:hypothetical protein
LTVSNYFKKGNVIALFDDSDIESVKAAWDQTIYVPADFDTSAWRQPRLTGPWSQVDLVGHRAERMILDDIRITEGALRFNPPNPSELENELADLQAELTARRKAAGWSSN